MIEGGRDDSGHTHDDVLEYDPKEDSMVTVSQMTQARYLHAVSVVETQDYSQWCQ